MKNIIILLFLTTVVISCAPESKITNSWKSSKRTKRYQDIVVLALTNDVPAKKLVENDLAAALKKKNVIVAQSIDLFPPSFSKDTPKEEMLSAIRKSGGEAILTVSLINKETQSRYVPGSPGFTPGFWGYYSYWSPTVYSPGYYTQDRVYYIETNLYDATTDELIWSAQSESYNPASLTGFSKELASILATKLEKDNIIGPFTDLHHSTKKITSKR